MYNLFFLLALSLCSSANLLSPLLSPNHPLQKPLSESSCNCENTNSTGPRTNPPSICNDARLGPEELPRKLPLLSFVSDYDRFGGLTPGQFLAKWTNSTTGRWIYPPKDGFHLDVYGNPILGNLTLEVGTLVDRFGSESGKYVSAADAPYDQRSLPPSSLTTPKEQPGNSTEDLLRYPFGYHVYTVKKPLNVTGGPIAPWFGQPGLGAQFFIGATGNITQLIEWGFLERLHKRKIHTGAGEGGGCGL